MGRVKTEEEKVINEIINDLTDDLQAKQEHILEKIRTQLNLDQYTFQQFNGRFGGKNNTYVDSARTQFPDFDDFYARWIKGLIDQYESDKSYQIKTYGRIYEEKSSFKSLKLMQDNEIERFVRTFLERNFYKKINERTRAKPNEKLWSVWFGYKLTYGLLIAPVKRSGNWTNDKSEIRKARYSYWTVGHVLTEGLIDPALEKPIRFNSLSAFLQFYQSVLKRISASPYEQEFSDRYVEYLNNSNDAEQEPFLIPEVRYAGLTKKHDYRLDFTSLNAHTMEYVGFEISPASTHMNVVNLKNKQFKVNDELKEKWEKEMRKRNDYFKEYGITTLTFTDSMLSNIADCFKVVSDKLNERPKIKIGLESQLERLAKTR